MTFTKYPHIERLGMDEVDGILDGVCHVFPKIDGTNASVWFDGSELRCGSRNREISTDNDNAGFAEWVHGDGRERLLSFFGEEPDAILYGEWLVPHSLKTYRDEAWRRFYVFDVMHNGFFRPWHYYNETITRHGLDCIPLLERVSYPTVEHLTGLLDRNTYLIQDGCGVGEGIVIKRYGFVNRYGRTPWAKIVRNEFKEQNAAVFGVPDIDMVPIEVRIAAEFMTTGRVEKIKAKMRDTGPMVSRRIPELLSRAWNDLITDEMWNILKKYKNPTVDFRRLNKATIDRVKALSPELFG